MEASPGANHSGMNTGPSQRLLSAPLADVAKHAVVGAFVTLGSQQLEQAPRRQPLARRTLAVRLQHRLEAAQHESPGPRPRLNLA